MKGHSDKKGNSEKLALIREYLKDAPNATSMEIANYFGWKVKKKAGDVGVICRSGLCSMIHKAKTGKSYLHHRKTKPGKEIQPSKVVDVSGPEAVKALQYVFDEYKKIAGLRKDLERLTAEIKALQATIAQQNRRIDSDARVIQTQQLAVTGARVQYGD
jgi:hypothetical protein